MFIRPHHKKQYKQMLDGLIGQSADLTTYEAQERNGKERLT